MLMFSRKPSELQKRGSLFYSQCKREEKIEYIMMAWMEKIPIINLQHQ